MPSFCKIRTTTLRFSAWPSVVALGATCSEAPIASRGKDICKRNLAVLFEKSQNIVGAFHAEFLIQGRGTDCGSIALYLNYIGCDRLLFISPLLFLIFC